MSHLIKFEDYKWNFKTKVQIHSELQTCMQFCKKKLQINAVQK